MKSWDIKLNGIWNFCDSASRPKKTPLRPDPSPWPSRPSINPWAKIMVKRITFARQRQTAWSIEKNSSSTINGGPAITKLARFLLQSARFLFGRFWDVTFPPAKENHLYAGQGARPHKLLPAWFLTDSCKFGWRDMLQLMGFHSKTKDTHSEGGFTCVHFTVRCGCGWA